MTTLVTPLLGSAAITTNTTPAMGSFTIYDATAGSLSVTLPGLAGLNVGAYGAVQKVSTDTTANTVTFTCAGSDTFDNAATTEVLRIPGQIRTLQVVSVGGTKHWKVASGNSPISSLDLRYAPLPVGLASLASLAALSVIGNATASSAIPTAVSLASTAVASTICFRDTNANLGVNSLIQSVTTTATAAGTTTLTVASTNLQQFTGSTTQTVVLPSGTTLSNGQQYVITNRSSGAVTVNKNGGSTLQVLAANSQLTATLISNGTSAGTWDVDYSLAAGAPATSGSSLLKGNGSGGFSNAVSATDYAPATSGSSILKASSGGFANAVAGTDYAAATSGSGILKGNGAGGFSTATVDVDYTTPTGVETLTNKRHTKRVSTTNAPGATPSMNTDNYDQFIFTGMAAAVTSMTTNLTGTPTDGDELIIRFKDNGTARAVTWGAKFVTGGGSGGYTDSLLTTTVINKTHILKFLYDATAAVWVCTYTGSSGY